MAIRLYLTILSGISGKIIMDEQVRPGYPTKADPTGSWYSLPYVASTRNPLNFRCFSTRLIQIRFLHDTNGLRFIPCFFQKTCDITLLPSTHRWMIGHWVAPRQSVSNQANVSCLFSQSINASKRGSGLSSDWLYRINCSWMLRLCVRSICR
jgi:hypothetical protein